MPLSDQDVTKIVSSRTTVSDKIRELDAEGVPRAEIARVLDKRYQHVRNVLEGDKTERGQPRGQVKALVYALFEEGGRTNPQIAEVVRAALPHAKTTDKSVASMKQDWKKAGGRVREPVLRRAGPPGVPRSGTQVFRLVVGADGELVLPEAARARLGVGPRDVVMGHVEGDRLVLMNAVASARLAQDLVRATIPGDDSLVDSLIRDRRREAAQEANA